eukprot:COSAG01_NODE_5422_length_4272_cov_103.375030_4_plen_193_part_00
MGLLRGFLLWAFRLWWVRACYAPTTPQQQHNNTTPTPTPYSTSTRSRLLSTPTFLPTSRQTYWVTTTSMADEARPASPGEAILASLPVGVARLFRFISCVRSLSAVSDHSPPTSITQLSPLSDSSLLASTNRRCRICCASSGRLSRDQYALPGRTRRFSASSMSRGKMTVRLASCIERCIVRCLLHHRGYNS